MWDMWRRFGLLLLLLALFGSREVRANYTEAHLGGVDVRVTVGRDGHFAAAHKLTYHVLAGAMRSLTIQGFEDDLRFAPTGTATTADGRSFGLTVARDDKGLHVNVDDPKGIKRGDYTLELDYEGSLVGGSSPRVALEGAFYRLRFATPPMTEGVDGMRVVLDLPSAPTEPRVAASGDEGDSSELLSALRRGAERDELELVRPHVAKGQGVSWYARVDPKAMPALDDPALRPRAQSAAPITRSGSELPWIVAAAAALALFALSLAKHRLLGDSAAMRGLVPLPATVRLTLAALVFGAGVYVEADGRALVAASLVAAALPLVAWRASKREPSSPASRPGAWLVLRPDDAFAQPARPADWLDATTPRGRLVLAGLSLGLSLAAFFARRAEGASYWIGIDALALVPVFFSGTSFQAPPDSRRAAAALQPIARELEACEDVRVAPYALRDELRLLVMPRLAMPGVIGVELGVAWEGAGGATLATYEALVRVHDGSFAAAKMAAYAKDQRALPGRKPEERVYRFEPAGPSVGSAVALVRELADTLHDRRLVIATPIEWEGAERRLPPNVRRALAVASA